MTGQPSSLLEAYKAQLRKPGGLALAFTSIGLTLIAYFIVPNWALPAQAFFAILILFLGFAWVSFEALREVLTREHSLQSLLDDANVKNRAIPKVLTVMPDPQNDRQMLLLLERNALFGQSMLVSIYYEDDRNFELFVGSGEVANVQSNGFIQVNVSSWVEAHEDVRRSILTTGDSKLERLLIRPAPTSHLIDRRIIA